MKSTIFYTETSFVNEDIDTHYYYYTTKVKAIEAAKKYCKNESVARVDLYLANVDPSKQGIVDFLNNGDSIAHGIEYIKSFTKNS